MREIGGYIELDKYRLPLLHEDAIALNCGRNALAYLLRARHIKKLWISKYICDSVTSVCDREGIPYSFYSIGMDFLPDQEIELGEDEWLYFVNYYSQFDNDKIKEYVDRYSRVIIDHAQSYFQTPIPGVDTLYTCRKYFGVADGAFLYTDAKLEEELEIDESYKRMNFLLGRYERTASEFYVEYVENNDIFYTEPIKRMSKLTLNLLRGIDYKHVKDRRIQNYSYLHKTFGYINKLSLSECYGTFMYPLMVDNGDEVRKKLQSKKIYVPTLWPDVYTWCNESDTEYILSKNILPLPIDQRYDIEDMDYMISLIESEIG